MPHFKNILEHMAQKSQHNKPTKHTTREDPILFDANQTTFPIFSLNSRSLLW